MKLIPLILIYALLMLAACANHESGNTNQDNTQVESTETTADDPNELSQILDIEWRLVADQTVGRESIAIEPEPLNSRLGILIHSENLNVLEEALPETVLENLQGQNQQIFETVELLFTGLEQTLGTEAASLYQDIILDTAVYLVNDFNDIVRGRPYTASQILPNFTILFTSEGLVGGEVGCNGIEGKYTMEANQISVIDPLNFELAGCIYYHSFEDSYKAALRAMTDWQVKDGQLYLLYDEGTKALIFNPEEE